jgi:hypothetical protein
MKKYLLPLLVLLFAIPAFSQYVHRSTLIGTGWKSAGGIISPKQGSTVAISADGNVAVVGGNLDSAARGAAWVYTRNGTTWTQMGNKLVPKGFVMPNTQAVEFGYGAAISDNGNTIAIGGYLDNTNKGAVWVFERQGNFWVQQGSKLVGTTTQSIVYQGENISLSGDGNTLLIGGREDAGSKGAVWIFQRTGSTWTQQGQKITISPNNGWFFGYGVALTADGNTAVIGMPGYRVGPVTNLIGAACFYRRTGNTWNLVQMETDSVLTNAQIGISATVSANGQVAAFGGPALNNNLGSIWMYRFNSTKQKWVKEQIIAPSNLGASAQLGYRLAISRGGDTLVASAWKENNKTGAIYVFTHTNGTWSQLGSKILSPISGGTDPQFGQSVGVSGNGKIFIAGRPGGTAPGAAFVYYTPDILSTKEELESRLKL